MTRSGYEQYETWLKKSKKLRRDSGEAREVIVTSTVILTLSRRKVKCHMESRRSRVSDERDVGNINNTI